jgi:LysM repeat protein
MGSNEALIKGQRLVLKASNVHYRDEGVPSGRRVLYTVRKGDTVVSISRQFQVSVAQFKTWNGVNQHHGIKPGKHVVLYVDAKRQQG